MVHDAHTGRHLYNCDLFAVLCTKRESERERIINNKCLTIKMAWQVNGVFVSLPIFFFISIYECSSVGSVGLFVFVKMPNSHIHFADANASSFHYLFGVLVTGMNHPELTGNNWHFSVLISVVLNPFPFSCYIIWHILFHLL